MAQMGHEDIFICEARHRGGVVTRVDVWGWWSRLYRLWRHGDGRRRLRNAFARRELGTTVALLGFYGRSDYTSFENKSRGRLFTDSHRSLASGGPARGFLYTQLQFGGLRSGRDRATTGSGWVWDSARKSSKRPRNRQTKFIPTFLSRFEVGPLTSLRPTKSPEPGFSNMQLL